MYYKCNSCKTLIGVHEMHGRMRPSWGPAIILLAHDPLFIISLLYDHSHPSSQQFSYKKLCLLGNENAHVYTHGMSPRSWIVHTLGTVSVPKVDRRVVHLAIDNCMCIWAIFIHHLHMCTCTCIGIERASWCSLCPWAHGYSYPHHCSFCGRPPRHRPGKHYQRHHSTWQPPHLCVMWSR